MRPLGTRRSKDGERWVGADISAGHGVCIAPCVFHGSRVKVKLQN